jgi:hypothetical protein
MRVRRRSSALASLVLIGSVLVPPAAAGAEAPTGDAGTGPARTVVTLITGDRVAVSTTPDGRRAVTVIPDPDGSTTAAQTLSSGPHLYVVPQDAAGAIGAPLDLSLFDVTVLIAGGYADESKPLDLAVTYQTGVAPRALPGMQVVDSDTLRQPRDRAGAFGTALRSYARGVAAGQPDQLFDGIARLALAGAAAPPASQPTGKLYTLTIKAFDRTGRRANGDLVTVVSVDNPNSFLAGQTLFRGQLAYSVPAGTYSVASYLVTRHPDGTTDFSLITEPDVAVSHDTVVVLDARMATRVDAHTPDPTTPVVAQLALQRNPVNGPTFTTTFTTFDATPLYATPTRPVDAGQLYFHPSYRLSDPAGGRYIYDLDFPYAGVIPSDLDRTVNRDELATIDSSYHSPQPGRAEYDARIAVMPWQADIAGIGTNLAAPLRRTEYVLPAPGMLFLHAVVLDAQSLSGELDDVVRSYRPGQRSTEEWGRQPMAPGIQQQPLAGQSCPACRSGDHLSLMLFPHVDSDGHVEVPDSSTTTNLEFYQDGKFIAQQPSGFATLPMSPDPASYRIVLDATRDAGWWPTTTHTRTEWTFTSTERAADPLPPGWVCGGKGGGGGGGRDAAAKGDGDECSFEPLLFLSYRPDAGIDDVVAAGQPATVDVSVDHQRGSAPTSLAGVDAQVSFDDGATWAAVTTRPTADKVTLTYPQPALDATTGFASLRITARDAAGSEVTQTVTRAYPLSATPPAGSGTSGTGPATRRACSTSAVAPYAQCMAIVNTAASGLDAAGDPNGYGPSDVQSAYRLPPGRGEGRVVAIVDAYDNPNAEADLAVYRAHYGLPPCTTANGCFRKVNQRGQADPLPVPDPGWGLEIALDLDAVSAACPACGILLVEADSPSVLNLATSVNTAVALGATVVSNSYGSKGEFSGEQYLEGFYQHRGVPILVASGDYGYGNGALLINSVSYPAASQYVVAVGGTSLSATNDARGWAESVWAGATSGCSAYIHKPGWQKDLLCDKRTVADVAAVADPETGLAVYDSFGGFDGWQQVGGTSLATPIVASIYAMSDNPAKHRYASDLYAEADIFNDVIGGSNGECGGTYLCAGVPGYDGPTGLGTPNGGL